MKIKISMESTLSKSNTYIFFYLKKTSGLYAHRHSTMFTSDNFDWRSLRSTVIEVSSERGKRTMLPVLRDGERRHVRRTVVFLIMFFLQNSLLHCFIDIWIMHFQTIDINLAKQLLFLES